MDQTSFRKLSVFFPMWNEQDYIERAVDAAREECEDLLSLGDIADYEIIIVNDASTDRTAEMADALAAGVPLLAGGIPMTLREGGIADFMKDAKA